MHQSSMSYSLDINISGQRVTNKLDTKILDHIALWLVSILKKLLHVKSFLQSVAITNYKKKLRLMTKKQNSWQTKKTSIIFNKKFDPINFVLIFSTLWISKFLEMSQGLRRDNLNVVVNLEDLETCVLQRIWI